MVSLFTMATFSRRSPFDPDPRRRVAKEGESGHVTVFHRTVVELNGRGRLGPRMRWVRVLRAV